MKELKMKINTKLNVADNSGNLMCLDLKKGTYLVELSDEEVTFKLEGEDLSEEELSWKEEDTISVDEVCVYIADKSIKYPLLDLEWIEDNVEYFYEFMNVVLFRAPSGSSGVISVYKHLNEKNELVALTFNGEHPEDFLED